MTIAVPNIRKVYFPNFGQFLFYFDCFYSQFYLIYIAELLPAKYLRLQFYKIGLSLIKGRQVF